MIKNEHMYLISKITELNLHSKPHISPPIAFFQKGLGLSFLITESALLEIIVLLYLGKSDIDKLKKDDKSINLSRYV